MPVNFLGKSGSKPLIFAVAATAVAVGLGGYILRQEHRPAVLEVYVFALKSGRSVFIRTPNDRRILVDGGANADVIKELTEILPFYSRRIDIVIATDSENQNVSGLIDILERYKVDRVIAPAITAQSLGLSSSTDQVYSTFVDVASRHGITIEKVFAGEQLLLDEGTVADILFPAAPERFAYSRASAPELIMNISYGKNSILLAGSATPKTQKFIASSSPAHADALIFPQNPSAANLAAAFMHHFRPGYIVYSKTISKTVAKSPVKSAKPAKVTVDPLAEIQFDDRFNLKEQGTVKIVSDGSSIEIKKAP